MSLPDRRRTATARRRLALVLDPRFPGGTAAAVAAEIRTLAGRVDLAVYGLETAMFRDRPVNPVLQTALDACGITQAWNQPVIHADTVVLHNPSCLKFDRHLACRISCDTAILVCHENFLRPGGAEAFDVAHCLALVEHALVSNRRLLAPVSSWNRKTVQSWLARGGRDWTLTGFDWFNICDMTNIAPNPRPRDRRGRHSRPGFEKFPDRAALQAQFPPQAESCLILGADSLMLDPAPPDHWQLFRFGARAVPEFLAEIDFFVYFTNPQWRESFGRAIAEAIAAGKLVITDPATAEIFGSAVVASDGSDIDAIIDAHIAAPARYVAFVEAAQASLARFSPQAFVSTVLPFLDPAPRHAVL